MTTENLDALPPSSVALRLARITKREELILCEVVLFVRGFNGVNTVLRRAGDAGRVEVGGEIENHFADVLDADHSMVETVSLDARSYAALKNHWMRWRVERQ